jgi:hypothetical protein
VNPDARNEIAASVGAHADLGPGYESAVAEGLIERIGEEIDKRVDARLRGAGQPVPPLVAMPSPPPMPHLSVPQSAPGHLPPPQLASPANGQLPVPQAAAPGPARRSTGASVVSMILAIASMGLGVGATAVIAANLHSAPAALIAILFVWVAIAMVNAAHARSYWADGGQQHRHHHLHG